jgi:hypothetical protein
MRFLALLMLLGCGEPCRESARICAGREVSTCVDGQWGAPVRLMCGAELVDPSGTSCSVPKVACPGAVRQ